VLEKETVGVFVYIVYVSTVSRQAVALSSNSAPNDCAYPFLPVNSCCTDVVLNSPCGCSSTLPNSGCGQDPCGTNVIIASNVLYNGPALDCIIVEPCDTLNVILQKIDEIICNLLIQINTLNIQISNITGQIININSEIIDINNTLDVCCNATTTTTTT